jgi:hypothetical protein
MRDNPTGESALAEERLLDRLNDRLRNAHYWLTDRPAQEQAIAAILEARGICMTLAEKHHKTNIGVTPRRSNS